MSWGDYHEMPYRSGLKERILGPFSFSHLAWLAPGLITSGKISEVYPQITFIDSMVFNRIHLLVPVLISLVFAYFKDKKTNLTLFDLIVTKIKIRFRRRVYYYRRKNMPKIESR